MSSNTNIGNTPVNQGYVQLIHTGETGGIDGTLRTLYDGDGTAADLLIASDKVKVSTELFIGAKTLTEFIQDTVGTMFTTGNSLTNVSVTYDDANNNIDLNATGEVTLTGSQTLTNKTLTSPVINTSVSGTAILDEDDMSSNSDSKLATQQSIKAYVDAEVSSLVSSAPTALDTLDELAAALGDDANFATTTATSLGEKLVKASNLSDLTNTTTARSNLGLGSLATANNISVSNFNDAALQTSSESFADNDTSLMTSAAIQDKIESFGFTTNTGDMTGVSITASNPLDISQSNTTSGSYSATISLVASEFGGYLADMTESVVPDNDELAVLDNGTLKRKQIDEIRLTAFDATGFSSGISFDGSTANGVLTFKDSDEATVESNLTFDGTNLDIAADDSKLRLGTGNDGQIYVSSDNLIIRNVTADKDVILQSDDGSGGETAYITLDGSASLTKFHIDTKHTDSVKGIFGDSSDLQIYHNGSHSYIDQTGTGNLYIRNTADDKHIIISTDDGSGGVDEYMKFKGDENLIRTLKSFRLHDSVQLQLGDGADCDMLHDGSEMIIRNDTGNFTINQRTDDGDLILKCDDGSGGTTAYLTLDGSAESIEISKKMQFPASHSADKIVMYSGGNEKIGTEANTLLFTGANHVFHDTSNNDMFKITSSGVYVDDISGLSNGTNRLVLDDDTRSGLANGVSLTGVNTVYICCDETNNGTGEIQFLKGTDNDLDAGTAVQMARIDNNSIFYINDIHSMANNNNRLILDDDTNSSQANGVSLTGANHVYICPDETNNGTGDVRVIKGTDNDLDSGTAAEIARIDNSGNAHFDADVVAFSSTVSDKRLKENITTIQNGLDKVLSLRGVEYDWNATSRKGEHDIGLIAQEVEKVIPEVVVEHDLCTGEFGLGKEKTFKTVDYEKIVGVLVEAIKELKQEIEDLK